MAIAKDGVIVTQMGTCLTCSNGEMYVLTGRILSGPRGMIASNVENISEAMGIVLGMHGGKQL